MAINFKRLWEQVTLTFPCKTESIHGPEHWRRVEDNGLIIARHNHAVDEVVRLFAVFHDSQRAHDGWDDTHGARGADYAARLRGTFFDLSDEHMDLLQTACRWHTHGQLSEDPTIGTCWDADRLDLWRVGIAPEAQYMSTERGRILAQNGQISGGLTIPSPKN